MPPVTTKCGRLSLGSIHRCEWMSTLPEEVFFFFFFFFFIMVSVKKRAVNQQVGTLAAVECRFWRKVNGDLVRHRGNVPNQAFSHCTSNECAEGRLQRKHFDRIQYLECDLTSFVVLYISHHIPITHFIVIRVSAWFVALISGRDRWQGWTSHTHIITETVAHPSSNLIACLSVEQENNKVEYLIKMMGFPNLLSCNTFPTRNRNSSRE